MGHIEKIIPVILAGGSGTRLWPLSRKSYPKQFAKFYNERSLFQECVLRFNNDVPGEFDKPLVLTSEDYRFIVGEQLREIGSECQEILVEPIPKNTAPAILAACLYYQKMGVDTPILICPSDHLIPDAKQFSKKLFSCPEHILKKHIVCLGVLPNNPETGYGYIKQGATKAKNISYVEKFIEKPNLEHAQKLILDQGYLWNAGIFLFRPSVMLAEFKKYNPELLSIVNGAIYDSKSDLDFKRMEITQWEKCPNISVDYCIMERSKNLVVLEYGGQWSDLGDWSSILKNSKTDINGVAVAGRAIGVDCSNSLLRSEDDRIKLVGLGLKNVIAIATRDAVLVADLAKSQEVKKLVDMIKKSGDIRAETFPKDHRPWGWFESLTIAGRFQVKRIFVKPGAALSLQSHLHRSEHWVVVMGTAKTTVDDKVNIITEGESIYIPVGAIHRLENSGKLPLELIEVQTGSYLGEDDIVRYEDIYKRK